MKIKITTLDRLFSQYIRARDNWTCQRCGKQYTPRTQALHCSHFHGRRKKSVRFDPENCVALCYGCHVHLGSNPEEHRQFMLDRLGQKRYDALLIRANTPKKIDTELTMIWLRERLREVI